MRVSEHVVEIAVGNRQIAGTIVPPNMAVEGMLFVHGWAGDQQQYLARAREFAALGCMSLTFDLYGHAATSSFQSAVARHENLADLVAAYDFLARLPNVNAAAVGVVGSSYGGISGRDFEFHSAGAMACLASAGAPQGSGLG
jgi:uncharacterized protein